MNKYQKNPAYNRVRDCVLNPNPPPIVNGIKNDSVSKVNTKERFKGHPVPAFVK